MGYGYGFYHDEIVERCDFSFCGGSIGTGSATAVRDGYGVMFWSRGTDITVRDCTFDEIWNNALSIQCNNSVGGTSSTVSIYTAMFLSTLWAVWTCGSITMLNNTAEDMYFVNNIIYDMGEGLMGTERVIIMDTAQTQWACCG